MANAQEAMTWLGMLFEPDDIFEVRVKKEGESGAAQSYYQMGTRGKFFAEVAVPIHEQNKRHVWVGVSPRVQVGQSVPSISRALWCDLNATITTREQVDQAVAQSGLPEPTMVVNSGHGFHLYWKLAEPQSPESIRQYSKGVHEALPSDSTHDPTRVMRVPGTTNVKDPENPKPCFIEAYNPERIYPIDSFPRATKTSPIEQHLPGAVRKSHNKLREEDFNTVVANWLDGQKHSMAVAVSGYLRKTLNYDKQSCLEEIARIHLAATGLPMDDNLTRVVDSTYSMPIAHVAGASKLYELGVFLKQTSDIPITFKAPPARKISLIDFSQDIKPQEFWVEGLVGPGLLTLWAAEPKTGKSFAVMQLGQALATGTQLWDFPTTTEQKRVLYFQGELSKQMVNERYKAMYGATIIRDVTRYGMTDKPAEPIDLVRNPEALMDLADDYDVVIVDPIAAFNRNDEQHSHSVNEVLSVFDALRAKQKAVILVHHTRKLQTDREGVTVIPTMNDVRGSGAWFAAVDALALHYRLGKTENTQVKFKFRAAPDREPLTLYRLPHGGFTHSRETYLALQNGMKVSVGHLN